MKEASTISLVGWHMAHWNNVILDRLDKFSGYEIAASDNHLTVQCENPNSFAVSIAEDDDGFLVNFDGWHEHFKDLEEALDCFAFGLSEQCRLKVTMRGKTECSWTVQFKESGDWVDDSTTGLILVPFWRPKSLEVRQNVLTTKK